MSIALRFLLRCRSSFEDRCDFSLVRQRHDPYITELDRVAVVLEVETADAGVVAHLGIVVDFDALVKDRHPRLATQHVLGLTAPQLAVPRVVAT